MDRQVPFGRIVAHVMPHFISRQVYTGAGKVGTEVAGLASEDVPFQLTQRADFFEEEVGLETTLKRPIVNTRDEPHADAQRYRRLHVIVGDANLAEVATFLKVGTTALVLAMIEDEFLPRDLTLAAPVAALRKVSYDLSLRQPLDLADGTTMTAIEMQWEYLDRAKKYAEEHGLECIGAPEIGAEVLRRWEEVLTGPGDRPRQRGRPGRLGGQAPAGGGLPGQARPALGRRPPGGHGPAVPRPAARSARWPPGRAGAHHDRRRGGPGGHRAADRRPGPTSGASASSAGPRRSWRPTGTPWCSTSAATRCGGCR